MHKKRRVAWLKQRRRREKVKAKRRAEASTPEK